MRTAQQQGEQEALPFAAGAVVVTPPVLDITCYAGDDVSIPVTVTQGGLPLALTTGLAQVRATLGDATVAGTLAITIVDAPAGKATIDIDGSMTEGLLAGAAVSFSGVYDWQQGTDVGNDVQTICKGKFTVERDVSRETP